MAGGDPTEDPKPAPTGVKGWFRRKVLEPLQQQLTQGATPGRLALAVALGIVIGAVPILGITALFCAAVAAVFRLNQPAILLANYLSYPVQLALFVPFFAAGAWLFDAPLPEFTVVQVQAEFGINAWATIRRYAMANVYAVGAWALVAPPATGLLTLVFRAILRRLPIPTEPRE